MVTDRYKLVHFDGPDLDEWELFDLEKDPHELRSVYGEPAYATVVADLKRSLDRLRAELKVPATVPAAAYGQTSEPGTRAKAANKEIDNRACIADRSVNCRGVTLNFIRRSRQASHQGPVRSSSGSLIRKRHCAWADFRDPAQAMVKRCQCRQKKEQRDSAVDR